MSNRPIPYPTFPLHSLERAVKQRASYLLGLYGVVTTDGPWTGASTSSFMTHESIWDASVSQFMASVTGYFATPPVMARYHELLHSQNRNSVTRNRYSDAELIAKWRSLPLCILDLGCNQNEPIKNLGRQCDGVAMMIVGDLKAAKKQLKQLSGDAIPWIGYWTIAFSTRTVETPSRDAVRDVA